MRRSGRTSENATQRVPFSPVVDGRQPLKPNSLYQSFRDVLELARIPHLGRSRGPRLQDLRHAFAVLRLLSWYETGADLGTKLPQLATYLGMWD